MTNEQQLRLVAAISDYLSIEGCYFSPGVGEVRGLYYSGQRVGWMEFRTRTCSLHLYHLVGEFGNASLAFALGLSPTGNANALGASYTPTDKD